MIYIAKILLIVVSGDDKADLAIRFAYNSLLNERFEDIKIVFFGPSQKRILTYEGELKNMLNELRKRGVVDSACVNVAKSLGIDKSLEEQGLNLAPAGARISYFLDKGYVPITF